MLQSETKKQKSIARENQSLRQQLKLLSQSIDEQLEGLKPQVKSTNVTIQNSNEDTENISQPAQQELNKIIASIKTLKRQKVELTGKLEFNQNAERLGDLQSEIKQYKREVNELTQQRDYYDGILNQYERATSVRQTLVPSTLKKHQDELLFARDKFRQLREKCRTEEKAALVAHQQVISAEKLKRRVREKEILKKARSFGNSFNVDAEITMNDIEKAKLRLVEVEKSCAAKISNLKVVTQKLNAKVNQWDNDIKILQRTRKANEQKFRINSLKIRELSHNNLLTRDRKQHLAKLKQSKKHKLSISADQIKPLKLTNLQ